MTWCSQIAQSSLSVYSRSMIEAGTLYDSPFVIRDSFDMFTVSIFHCSGLHKHSHIMHTHTHTQKHRYPQSEHLSRVRALWKEWECSSGVLSGFDLWYVLNVGVRDNRLGAGRVEETWREGEGDRHDDHTGPWNLPFDWGEIFIGKCLLQLILTCWE